MYLDPEIRRMAALFRDRRVPPTSAAAVGAEAIIVSHQLPIWITRLGVEGAVCCRMTRVPVSATWRRLRTLAFSTTDF